MIEKDNEALFYMHYLIFYYFVSGSGSGSSKPPKKMPRKTWMTTKMDDPNYPKGPRNGYNIFFAEQASQHSNEDGDIRTKMAERWKSLSDTEKAVS